MIVTQQAIDEMYQYLEPLPPLLPAQTLTYDYGFGLVERVQPTILKPMVGFETLSSNEMPIGVAFGEYIYGD